MAASPKKGPSSKGEPQGRPPRKAKSTTAKAKKKVSKKPKHLGRKLATANDVTEQERIRKQMELLEATKRTLSSQKKTSPEKKKDQKKDVLDRGRSISQSTKKQQQPKAKQQQRAVASTKSIPVTTHVTRRKNNGTKLPLTEAKSAVSKGVADKSSKEQTSQQDGPTRDSRSSAESTTVNTDSTTKDDGEKTYNDSEIAAATVGRQRGKRRRGRKDTSQIVSEEQQQAKPSTKELATTADTKDASPPKPRRCIGRKPVTDFEVGATYSGTVVYAKPFGIFVDIGCHSDAFCHVSRLADTFVEDPLPLFPPGTEIPSLRIVQVDRETQRITGSLQTEARMAEELASAQARQQRKQKHRLQQQQERQNLEKRRNNKLQQQHPSDSVATSDIATTTAPSPKRHRTLEPSASSKADDNMGHLPATSYQQDDDKRARKLARRAARRAAKESGT